MTMLEVGQPRHQLDNGQIDIEQQVDMRPRFYLHTRELIVPGQLVVHTFEPEEDPYIDRVFGEDTRNIGNMFEPNAVGLWVGSPDGLKNPDFLGQIQESDGSGIVALMMGAKPEEDHNEAYVLDRTVRGLNRMGYERFDIKGITTPQKPDSLPTGRTLFAVPAVNA